MAGQIVSLCMRAVITAAATLMLALPLPAAIDTYTFATPEQQARYLALGKELRCPKCDGQSIGDSNAPIANDLRAVIYEQLQNGRSDGQIVDFMEQRYGEFVLYKPKMSGKTLGLWLAPLFFIAIGIGTLLMIVMRSRRRSVVEADAELSAEERARLQKILERGN